MIPTTPVRQPGPPGRGGPRSALATLVELHQRRPATGTRRCNRPASPRSTTRCPAGSARVSWSSSAASRAWARPPPACSGRARWPGAASSRCTRFDHDPATLVAAPGLRAARGGAGRPAPGQPVVRGAAGPPRRRGGGGTDPARGARLGPAARAGQQRIAAYGDRLVLYPASTTRTDVAALSDEVSRFAGESYVLFVDYVQKVPAAAMSSAHVSENDRIGRVVAALKEVALEQRAAVVAVSAAGEQGLTARRLHLHHLRGRRAWPTRPTPSSCSTRSSTSCRRPTWRTRRSGSTSSAGGCFSVEKNRNGPSGVDVEFAKEFDSSRFDPHEGLGDGAAVARAGRRGLTPGVPVSTPTAASTSSSWPTTPVTKARTRRSGPTPGRTASVDE